MPGATVFYKLQGAGPLLVILHGGDGDADASDALARHLVDRYTILSYDRRGLSRSRLDDPSFGPELSTHGDDLFRLLQALAAEPALVFGSSIGALLGLDLVARHREHVRLLIAHEPPATELLAEPDRADAARDQDEVEHIYRREGVAAAMRRFVAVTGINHDDREPDVELPMPRPERIANLEFFLTYCHLGERGRLRPACRCRSEFRHARSRPCNGAGHLAEEAPDRPSTAPRGTVRTCNDPSAQGR
jgi:pimeloyl-ACP methyl ester carboxylesterase